MKSTTGEYYRGLDHVRAAAALIVFVWHFLYGREGSATLPAAPAAWGLLTVFEQGHVGVALFMSLSGYLFARLLAGKDIDYRCFFWNRLLRLFPLLVLVMLVRAAMVATQLGDARAAYWYLVGMPRGLIFPTWPNGGWSIAVELHFYLVLPGLLVLGRWWKASLWAVILAAVMLRAVLWLQAGSVQDAAYWTLVGRIDQFAFGVIAFHARQRLAHRHAVAAAVALAFLALYGLLATVGGVRFDPRVPSASPLWIVTPTLEGAAFASLIAWYDTSFAHGHGRVSRAVATVGEYSYSIYLLHFFFVFAVAGWIHHNLLDLSSPIVALPVALLAFAAMVPLAYLSMRFVERPFLRFRRPYALQRAQVAPAGASSVAPASSDRRFSHER